LRRLGWVKAGHRLKGALHLGPRERHLFNDAFFKPATRRPLTGSLDVRDPFLVAADHWLPLLFFTAGTGERA
jgi:hypothetical protein